MKEAIAIETKTVKRRGRYGDLVDLTTTSPNSLHFHVFYGLGQVKSGLEEPRFVSTPQELEVLEPPARARNRRKTLLLIFLN